MNRRSFLRGLAASAALLVTGLRPDERWYANPQARAKELGFVSQRAYNDYFSEIVQTASEWFAPKVVDQVFSRNPFLERLRSVGKVGRPMTIDEIRSVYG